MTENLKEGDKSVAGNQQIVNFWNIVAILLKWRRFIAINIVIVTVFAIGVSFLLPKWYLATASILPPKDQGGLNMFGITSAAVRSLPLGQRLAGIGGQNLGVYNYLAILKSRTAMEAVINKFNLIDVYGISNHSMERAIRELEENTSFDLQEDNYITIQVFDKNPQRAAEIANYFVDILNSISIQLGTQEAKTNREFIEKRLESIRQNLQAAEDALQKYQEQTGVIVSPDQSSSSISAIAELYAMKAKREVEIAILERTVTQDNDGLRQLKIELNEIEKKLNKVPQTGIESVRLYRNAAIQQKIVEYLTPLYEQAKIDEQKDVPVILMLDKAIPPENKATPKRLLIAISSGFTALLLSILFILVAEHFQNVKKTNPQQFNFISNLFRRHSTPLKS